MKCEACGKEGTFWDAVACNVVTYDLDVALGKEPLSVARVLMLNGFRSRIRADERAKVLAMARERVAQMWRVADARDEWVRLPDVLTVIERLLLERAQGMGQHAAMSSELAELRAIKSAAEEWRAYMDDPTVAGAVAEQRAIILDALLAGRGPTP